MSFLRQLFCTGIVLLGRDGTELHASPLEIPHTTYSAPLGALVPLYLIVGPSYPLAIFCSRWYQ